MRVKIDLRKTAIENAQYYYEKAKKAREKIKGAKLAIAETERKLKKLEIQHAQRKSESPLKVKKRSKWYEKFRWFYSSDNILVIGGRDATTNEIIIKKHTTPEHIVLHSDIPGSPFMVITEKNPPKQTIQEAAIAVASYSKAWSSSYSVIDVYWVKAEQISKSAPSGEYLTKGSFMIYGKKNYIKNVILKICIGLTEGGEVIGGPEQSITNKTIARVTLVPGVKKSSSLAREILRYFQYSYRLYKNNKEKKNHPEKDSCSAKKSETELDITIDEIQRFIPAGKGEILEKK